MEDCGDANDGGVEGENERESRWGNAGGGEGDGQKDRVKGAGNWL